MEIIRNLFYGFPHLWGGGVAHSVMILALVIALGLALGKLKVARVSLGLTWVLFIGILFGYLSFNLDEHLLHFMKEFGLILFVYSIGLQVGPGFFSSFKKGGLSLNMLTIGIIALSIVTTLIIQYFSGESITTMAGILSGAVTNTPGLGAAQQANSDINGVDAPEIAMGYALTYPMGVIGVILSFLILRFLLRINSNQEEKVAESGLGQLEDLTVRPFSVEVSNKMIDGKTVKEIRDILERKFVISRLAPKGSDRQDTVVNGRTILHVGDIVNVISTPKDVDPIIALLGKPAEIN